MKYVEETLNPDESIIGGHLVQTRWQYMGTGFIGVLFFLTFLVSLASPEVSSGSFFFWFLFLTGLMGGYTYLKRYTTEHGVTNRRLVKKTGVLARKGEEILLKKTESVQVSQGLAGRLLGYGDVRATGTGSQEVIFKDVKDPMAAKRRIEDALQGAVQS